MNEALGKAARQLVEHIESTIDYKRAVNHIEHLWLQKQIEIRPESLEEKIISSELSNSKKRALTKTTRILVNKKFRLTEEYRGRLFQKDINNISLSF